MVSLLGIMFTHYWQCNRNNIDIGNVSDTYIKVLKNRRKKRELNKRKDKKNNKQVGK